jgi:hypothetical protein
MIYRLFMKNIFALLILTTSLHAQAASLNCSFGIMGVAILTTQTDLNADGSVGAYSKAAFQGSPAKEIPNVVFSVNEPLLYFFQLDEGFDANNISITVSTKRNTENDFLAVAENPQTPQFKKMNGSCKIQ